jgi:hypothetical protein
MTLLRKKGILVSFIGQSLSAETVNQAMRAVRQERERSNLGVSHQKRKPSVEKKRTIL